MARIVVLSGAGCSGKTAVGTSLKLHWGYAQVSVWDLRLMHLVRWEDRDQGDDYEPGCLIAEAALTIYARRGKSSVLEDIGDREAIALVERLRQVGLTSQLVSLVADSELIRERLARRNCQPSEFDWLVGLNAQIRARPVVPGERRYDAREWIGCQTAFKTDPHRRRILTPLPAARSGSRARS